MVIHVFYPLLHRISEILSIMSVFDQVRLVIYRVNKRGLEVFLINNPEHKEQWTLPAGILPALKEANEQHIHLEKVLGEDGQMCNGLAIEGDWHEIPSIRKLIKDDVKIVKAEIKNRIPELEQGSFVAVKEAFKRVMPHEYTMLKELKDIIRDRNSIKYI